METNIDLISELTAAFNGRPNKLNDADKRNLERILFIPLDNPKLCEVKRIAKCILESVKRNTPYEFLVPKMLSALTGAMTHSEYSGRFADARVPYDKFAFGANNER